jgi:hypothetical protein
MQSFNLDKQMRIILNRGLAKIFLKIKSGEKMKKLFFNTNGNIYDVISIFIS